MGALQVDWPLIATSDVPLRDRLVLPQHFEPPFRIVRIEHRRHQLGAVGTVDLREREVLRAVARRQRRGGSTSCAKAPEQATVRAGSAARRRGGASCAGSAVGCCCVCRGRAAGRSWSWRGESWSSSSRSGCGALARGARFALGACCGACAHNCCAAASCGAKFAAPANSNTASEIPHPSARHVPSVPLLKIRPHPMIHAGSRKSCARNAGKGWRRQGAAPTARERSLSRPWRRRSRARCAPASPASRRGGRRGATAHRPARWRPPAWRRRSRLRPRP